MDEARATALIAAYEIGT